RRVRAHVHARVREERKFPSFDELRAQIERDAATARELTSRLGR
ncbi:MAG: riboflavin biosynthesis protein RibF, partial [Myxococcales bacterium]|nr:riboflavin biosynthesis protein RibF [Myxococcales bacterium]